jgi:dTDP-4-amino-4,6-dideoxygalactose transaminase
MNIRFGRPNINLCDSQIKEIGKILNSGWVSIGFWVESLEERFRKKFHMKHAIACSSATTGLIIAVKAAGWKGRRIAVPAFTWPSTVYALNCNNNAPVAIDIDPNTWLMSGFNAGLNVEGVLPVDVFGNEADDFIDFPRKRKIYDAAHGYGLPNLGKRGIAEVVSLSFTKIVTGTEGGIILTDDDNLAEVATELRRLSGRMNEVNAYIATRSMDEYDIGGLDKTQDIILKYVDGITVPFKRQVINTATNYSVFSILFEETATRNAIMAGLARNGVETKIYYDPVYAGYRNTEYVYNHILSLPTHCGVSEHQDEIIDIINRSAEKTPGKEYLRT